MNTKLFDKVKELMLENPGYVNMGCYYVKHPCGTMACIAGWTIMAAGLDIEKVYFDSVINLPDTAATLLGIDNQGLFYPDHWPLDLYFGLFTPEPTDKGYAQVCCDAIDRFIANPGEFLDRKKK